MDSETCRIAATTFSTVFLAETGDKTQLAAIAAVAKTGRPTVFLAASAALVAVILLGVAGGTVADPLR